MQAFQRGGTAECANWDEYVEPRAEARWDGVRPNGILPATRSQPWADASAAVPSSEPMESFHAGAALGCCSSAEVVRLCAMKQLGYPARQYTRALEVTQLLGNGRVNVDTRAKTHAVRDMLAGSGDGVGAGPDLHAAGGPPEGSEVRGDAGSQRGSARASLGGDSSFQRVS